VKAAKVGQQKPKILQKKKCPSFLTVGDPGYSAGAFDERPNGCFTDHRQVWPLCAKNDFLPFHSLFLLFSVAVECCGSWRDEEMRLLTGRGSVRLGDVTSSHGVRGDSTLL